MGVHHHRRSIRLPEYDYSQAGAYFITICTQGRIHQFGEIKNGIMRLNEVGEIVADEWKKTEIFREKICLGEWVIMPNHFHAIIHIITDWGTANCRDTARRAPTRRVPTCEQFGQPVVGSIPTIIRSFKSAATKKIHGIWGNKQIKLWQRNYWEHIIRNRHEYYRIAQYIRNNPAKWEQDKLNGGTGNMVMEPGAEYGIEPWMI